jgi:hypothetical protein
MPGQMPGYLRGSRLPGLGPDGALDPDGAILLSVVLDSCCGYGRFWESIPSTSCMYRPAASEASSGVLPVCRAWM